MLGNAGRPMLKINARGETVSKLQGMLRQLGYAIHDRPGFFGADTRDAVMDFQAKSGMHPTGVAGQDVLKLMQDRIKAQSGNTSLPNKDGDSTPVQGRPAYVDVWERVATPLEDDSLSDPALQGADTSTRTQTEDDNPEDKQPEPRALKSFPGVKTGR